MEKETHNRYEKQEILDLIEKGRSLEQIGYLYGVTRQRMYQVINRLRIESPGVRRKRQSDTWSDGQAWFWRTLTSKGYKTVLEKMDIMESLEIPTHCPVLGTELNYIGGTKYRRDDSPSIDQIIPSQGYSKGNLQIISWRANRIKNDATPDELIRIANYMKTMEARR